MIRAGFCAWADAIGAPRIVEVEDHETSETYIFDLDDNSSKPRLVERRHPRMQYEVEHHGDRLFILTNADGAEISRSWRRRWPRPQGALARSRSPSQGLHDHGFAVFARHLVRTELEDGLPRIVVRENRKRRGARDRLR